ncbi:MAG: glycosyltransferase family 4 protein [Armatimonadetes bacterium]|nr:glycosyltransferase family 4 protein [Armatimonadota bacterium]
MNVLFLSTWFPFPPDNGARIRVYNLIKALASRHKVHLISLLQGDSDRDNAKKLSDICEVVSLHESRWFAPGTFKSFLGFFSSRPRSAVDTFDSIVRRSVEQAIERIRPDVVIASTLGVAEYVPEDLGVPCILEQHNCDYAVLKRTAEACPSLIRRLRLTLGWKKFARWEAAVCRRFDLVTMVSEHDKSLLHAIVPDMEEVHVTPNGVDTVYYNASRRAPEPFALLYNGALSYGANLDAVRYFATDIYPVLAQSLPSVRLMVTGRTDGVDLSGIEKCPGIELTGYVDDIRDVLNKAEVCVVPLRQGGGSRLKILEAMAAGVPVVATTIGAEGIDVVDGEQVLIADDPSEIAACIERVLTDTDLAHTLSGNARKLVEERYSWSAIGESFVDMVERQMRIDSK